MSETRQAPRRRRRIGRALSELHYQLRTEGDSPFRIAGSVWLGTVIGCVPLWGAHLTLSIVLARWLRLSRVKTYLAAHVSNPLTAPFLLYGGYVIGYRIFGSERPRLTLDQLRAAGIAELGRNLLVGSFVLGVVLGAVLAIAAYVISTRTRSESLFSKLREETSRRYQEAGVFHWEFVRGKLKLDPMYRAILSSGVLPDRGRLVDLGCGRGILLALIRSAVDVHSAGGWNPTLPVPPRHLELCGVERNDSLAHVARIAVGDDRAIEVDDLSHYDPAPADVVLLLDVLHYMSGEHQVELIRRVAGKLPRGGLLVMREPDAAAGLGFQWTRLGERLVSIARLRWRQPFRYRTAASWCELLQSVGFETRQVPMSQGTPFANVLIEARRS